MSNKNLEPSKNITDDLDVLLAVLPPAIAKEVDALNNRDNLLEVILDLGRSPKARFVDGEIALHCAEITQTDLDAFIARIGNFDADNRAGIERTLHRIAAIRSRRGHVVGLTCRVGRAVYGTIDIIEDLIKSGKSVLIMGRPGVGKTTLLREAARIMAETTRVIIVDTSNEIGGDGDVPHPAVGSARRMQVAKPSLQHEVMIEAVENHNPQVIVIDEIGRELEAQAARTIAERGVQLIGTAHGNTLENLLLNPTLSDLVGGIESVTLSDEEARRRGTQKTVLERRAPPTFDILVEIQDRNCVAVQADVSSAVDSLLRGYPLPPEVRARDVNGKIHIQKAPAPGANTANQALRRGAHAESMPFQRSNGEQRTARGSSAARTEMHQTATETPENGSGKTISIFPYGVARNRLQQAAKQLGVPVKIARTLEDATALLTLRRYYRERQQPVVEAEQHGMPIYVLRANTVSQLEQFLADLFNLKIFAGHATDTSGYSDQTLAAIQTVLDGEKYVDLPPASATIRRLQHEMVRQANLISQSYGKDPHRHVRIFRD